MSSEGDDHPITRRELEDFKQFIDERFNGLRWQMMLVIGVATALIRFDAPTPVTAAAVIALVLKAVVFTGWRL